MTLAPPASSQTALDFSRPFIAEELTPLFHAEAYASLPEEVRRRYNQLHACYFNEQVAFFEQEMLSPALRALHKMPWPRELAEGLHTFHAEEQFHTAMFRALNRKAAPELYRQPYFFIRLPLGARAALHTLCSYPQTFPLVIWLALLQEERSLHYSKRCLAEAAELEPQFLAAHRRHLADEVGHLGWDEAVLDVLWSRAGAMKRWVNARLLLWMMTEFFHLPKRSGRRVVRRLGEEFPELDAPALCAQIGALRYNPAFLATLYSREIAPRTFARFDLHPEFALLARRLTAYAAAGLSV